MATTYNAGVVTAYGAAVRGGYTGTYEEFCRQQAGYAQSAAAVEQAKEDVQELVDGIPADYTQLSEDVNTLKEDFDDLDDRVTALEQGGSGSSLTDDIKQALLQIVEKVAYIDDDGQDYYGALEDALYPPADLVSISAVYTQSGSVYDTDSLDSLKSDLVVTALYDDRSTKTVTAYTLSGTLEIGISTIVVGFGGKSTTFTVVVEHYDNSIYNWDFTESLTDSKQSAVAVLNGSNVTRNSSGIVFSGRSSAVDLGTILARDRTYEIDIANVDLKVSNLHVRFIMVGSNASTGTGILLWRNSTSWQAYYDGSWSSTAYSLSGISALNSVRTIKIQVNASGKATLFCDNVNKGTDSHTYNFSSSDHLYIGNTAENTSGGNLYNITITGLRVYEGVV